jgi:hypothetical protein
VTPRRSPANRGWGWGWGSGVPCPGAPGYYSPLANNILGAIWIYLDIWQPSVAVADVCSVVVRQSTICSCTVTPPCSKSTPAAYEPRQTGRGSAPGRPSTRPVALHIEQKRLYASSTDGGFQACFNDIILTQTLPSSYRRACHTRHSSRCPGLSCMFVMVCSSCCEPRTVRLWLATVRH